ncbi:MAG: Hsp20/alpha crystallin family protein [Ignavibacteria bacterium]|nr:Hsp20/alpha crystallin family protein [Ignavibacteria bacterium]
MTLVKFKQPYELFKSFDKTFDEMVDEFFGYTPTLFTRTTNILGAMNVKETNESYNLEILLPGFTKDETNVEIEDDMLTISAKVEDTNSQSNEGYTRKEFVKKSFVRSFSIPENVNTEKITADIKDGVLNIVLTKKQKEEQKSKKRKIM